MYIMDHPGLTVLNFMENSIVLKRVKKQNSFFACSCNNECSKYVILKRAWNGGGVLKISYH